MYNQFFGFSERPFRLVPDPSYLFLSAHHEEALAHLKYAVSEGEGFVEIIGEVGTGKTLLCRTFLEQLNDSIESAYIFNPRLSAPELIRAINDEFGIAAAVEGIKENIDALNTFLMEKKAQGKKVVLVIDEAQNLDRDVLEQVRLLSNLETTRSKLLQIILAGQPELGELLDSHELRQLGQRITLSCRLRPLTLKETGLYIRHRLQVAARKPADIFTRSAVKKIHAYSNGIPRLINIACDRALLCAYGYNQRKVSGAIARAAVAELASRGEVKRRAAFFPGSGRSMVLLGLCALSAGILWFQSDFRILPAGWGDARSRSHEVRPQSESAGVSSPSTASNSAALEIEAALSSPDAGQAEAETVKGETVFSDTAQDDTLSSRPLAVIPEMAASIPEMGPYLTDVVKEHAPVAPKSIAVLGEDPGAGDLLSDSPRNVSILIDYLRNTPAAGSRERSLQTLLALWGTGGSVPEDIAGIDDDRSFFSAVAARNGLILHQIQTDFAMIRSLNLCAILIFDTPSDHGRVHLALIAAGEQTMTLDNGISGRRITASDEEIARYWSGDAYVLWKNFYNYEGTIPITSPDASIVTLKLHLRDLGHDYVDISTAYDKAARTAVEQIQAAHAIPVDGYVGPLTRMVLYNDTASLEMPRLRNPKTTGQSPADSGPGPSKLILEPDR
jgi:general secretion pathway protein A